MPLPCEFRSLSYSQNRNLALNLCLPQTWTPEPPPRQDLVRSKGDYRYSCWQHRHRAGLVQGLTWCGCGVPTGFLMFWAVGQGHLRLCLQSKHRFCWDTTASNCCEIAKLYQGPSKSNRSKGQVFMNWGIIPNHSESCLACLGFTVSLYHHQCPIIFLEHS